jgi:hypothetical protein
LGLPFGGVGMTEKTYKKHSLYERAWKVIMIPRKKFTGTDYRGVAYNEDDAIVLSDSSMKTGTPLRVKFRTQSAVTVPLYGDVSIYNLSESMTYRLITQGARLIIEAGYKNGEYGVIWNANVIHFIDRRENVTDRVLEMRCCQGYDVIQTNFAYGHITRQVKLADRFQNLTQLLKIESKSSQELDDRKQQSTRPSVVFGDGQRYLRECAKDVGGTLSVTDGTSNPIYTVSNMITSIPQGKELVISPKSGLIGTPAQTPMGVSFRCLLDPRLKFSAPNYQQIRLEHSEIKANFISIEGTGGQGKLPMHDKYGRYKLISVSHSGDTRGTEWYSNVTAVVNPEQLANLGLGSINTSDGSKS